VTSRPFLVLFLAVLVATMGISMVSPILPVYAERLGATGIWTGLTFSIFAVTQTIMSPFAGKWSDRYGRKPFITLGLLIYLVAALGYLTADTFVQVLAFRALSGAGTSLIFSVARAYIGDMVPTGREGRWFGVFAVADIMGFGIGPIFAGLLRDVFGFNAVFIGMAALMAGSAMIVTVLLPAHPERDRVTQGRPAAWGFRQALADRLVLSLTILMGLTSVTFGAVWSFLSVRLDALGITALAIGIAFAAESFASALAQPPVGRAVDRIDRRAVAAIGLAASVAVLVALGAVEAYTAIVGLLLLLGVAQATTMVAISAMQVVAGRYAGMGTVIGLGAAGGGVGIIVGSVAGGALVGFFGTAAAAFYFGAFVMAVGVVAVLLLLRGVTTSERPAPDLEGVTAPS
jgi:MFS transporter, DHA1 family, multidrug resistance protein